MAQAVLQSPFVLSFALELRRRLRALVPGASAATPPAETADRGGLSDAISRREAAEEALRQSEERFALALQGSNEGLWDWNLITNDVYLSPRWKEIVGYADNEIASSIMTFERLVHADDRDRRSELIADCVTGRTQRFQMECRVRHSQGHYVDAMLKGTAARNPAGDVIRMVGTLTDITEHRRDRRLLGLQYTATRALSEATTLRDSVARWLKAIGESGEWTAGCAWIVKGEALHSIAVWGGRDLLDAAWPDRMAATIMPGTVDTMAVRTWLTGEPRWYVAVDLDDPTAISEFSSGIAVPVVYAGRVVGAVQLFSRDVQQPDAEYLRILYSMNTQIEQALIRRQIEKDLAIAERKYREIVEHSVQGIYQTSEDGRFLSANAAFARMLGYASPSDLTSADPGIAGALYVDAARRTAFLEQIRANGVVTAFESQVRRRDGRMVWISENARVVQDRATGRAHFEGFVEDISERKQADRAKADFVSFATHQLRTPLSGIRWMLELAQSAEGAEAAGYVADAVSSAQRLIRLVNDLLDVSRMEDGQLPSEPEPTDLAALARSVVSELRPLAAERRQMLIVQFDDAPPAMVDPQLARQVVLNLISNAIKYTLDGGQVTVSLVQAGEAIECRVADTGIGIPEAASARLFEKFYRADNAVAVDTEGTGLGLYLVKLIVERSGGQVWCESREGSGSTFGFRLPLAGVGFAAAS